ncbi:MAG TPA: MoaD/ThiS family protein [Panacibacter sp.]|nr:MoaD/ThiS family protein [Panacibacter sp.]
MKMSILAFGIVKEIFGASVLDIELTDAATVVELKIVLEQKYPRLKQLASYMVAVNNEYAGTNQIITGKDEIAIIPPVSGG